MRKRGHKNYSQYRINAILVLYEMGCDAQEIADQMKMPKMSVWSIIKRYDP